MLRKVLPAAALAVVLLTLMARTRHSDVPLDAEDDWMPSSTSSSSWSDGTWEVRLEELRTLPAYREAEQALRDLEESRSALLKSADASDADAMLAAGANYQRTLQLNRDKLSQLGEYLDPAEARACLQDLVQQSQEGDQRDAMILEIRLGILAGVNSW
ncbi:MAG: hypothetical protein KJ000_03915 [Pirellulaceae bacterium]|nr:hypothetical protein [Pirellulaceae bacterium]